MTTPVYPCLWFDDQAQEASSIYCSLFKNSRIISESPLAVTFELAGKKHMALNGGPMFSITPAISLFATCDSVEETDRIWNELVKEGSVLIPIDTYPWSARYGWLKDRFGMTWQISLSGRKDGEQRIVPSMLFVGELFGKAAEAIEFYSGIFEGVTTPVMEKYPAGDNNEGKVLYSEFTLNEADLVAMDGPGEHKYSFTEGVSLVVECEDQTEIDHYWEKLTEGGEESMCGWLKDKFGVSWQVFPKILNQLMSDPEKAARVFESFKNMRKFEIDKLDVS
ncbi:MAG: VOC family protein [Draconibacterium sp.]